MSIADRLANWRNRLLANPAFQDWAAAFPLTRGVAQRRAQAVFDLTNGFVYSQILYACVELELLPALRAGAKSVRELAELTGLPEAGATRLARAAAAIGLLERTRDDRFRLGPHGAALLGNPSVFAMIRHHKMLYEDLADPVALLKGRRDDTALARFWAYARAAEPGALSGADVADYSALMAETQAFIAKDVLDAYSMDRHRKLMDVAGGEGAFLCAAAARCPQLELVLCDLPGVAARAEDRFREAGLSDRARAVGADVFKEPLPEGADIISLIRVLHDHDDESARALLRSIHAALPQGGRLLIGEPMAETPGAEPAGDAYFGMYLWAMGAGRPRTPEEIRAFLTAAGFVRCKILSTRRPLLVRAIIAERDN